MKTTTTYVCRIEERDKGVAVSVREFPTLDRAKGYAKELLDLYERKERRDWYVAKIVKRVETVAATID